MHRRRYRRDHCIQKGPQLFFLVSALLYFPASYDRNLDPAAPAAADCREEMPFMFPPDQPTRDCMQILQQGEAYRAGKMQHLRELHT